MRRIVFTALGLVLLYCGVKAFLRPDPPMPPSKRPLPSLRPSPAKPPTTWEEQLRKAEAALAKDQVKPSEYIETMTSRTVLGDLLDRYSRQTGRRYEDLSPTEREAILLWAVACQMEYCPLRIETTQVEVVDAFKAGIDEGLQHEPTGPAAKPDTQGRPEPVKPKPAKPAGERRD